MRSSFVAGRQESEERIMLVIHAWGKTDGWAVRTGVSHATFKLVIILLTITSSMEFSSGKARFEPKRS